MSYLRGLVQKANAPRPWILPRRSPDFAEPMAGFDEIVEEVLVAPPHRAATEAPRPAGPTVGPIWTAEPPIFEPLVSIAPVLPPTREPGQVTSAMPPSISAEPRVRSRTVMRRRLIGRAASEPLVFDRDVAPPYRETAETLLLAGDPERAPAPRDRVRSAPPVIQIVDREVAAPFAEHAPPRPSVQISIGRVDVRAVVTAAPSAERPPPFRPRLTLEDYLAQRTRERG